jgi:glutathione S-transferase
MAKPITIYGRILSPFVARVVLTAKAKGFPYEVVFPKDGIKTPKFLKMNPFGKIPTIKDGATIVYESNVVVNYLDAKSKTKRLVPAKAEDAAKVRLIGAVAAEYVQPPAVRLFRKKRGSPDPIDIPATLAELNKGLDALEKIMAKGKYAAGNKFSLADVYVPPALLFAVRAGAAFDVADIIGKKRPKVKKYWAAVQKDKLIAPVLQEMSDMMVDALAGKIPPLS